MLQFAGRKAFFGETQALVLRPLGAMTWLSRHIRLTVTAVTVQKAPVAGAKRPLASKT